MPAWPAVLPPYPLLEGFSFTPPKLLIGSQNDTGPPSVRRRTTAGHGIMNASWALLSPALRDVFMTFHEDELAGGALAFDLPHPFKDITVAARFDPDASPRYSPMGSIGAWRVDVTLFILP